MFRRKRCLSLVFAVFFTVSMVVGNSLSVFAATQTAKPAVVADYSDVPEKYKSAMKQAVEMGLLTPGKDGKLRPNDIMTVAEYATVQWRLYHSWFGKNEADNGHFERGFITLNGKDVKKHWAYVPVSCMMYTGAWPYMAKETKPPSSTVGPSDRILDIQIDKPATEALMYLNSGYVFANWAESDKIYSVLNKCDSKAIVSKTCRLKEMPGFIPGKYGDSNYDSDSASLSVQYGVMAHQIVGLLPLSGGDGIIPVQFTRQLTRAEVVYNMITIYNYSNANGFSMESAKDQKEYYWGSVEFYKNNK